MRVFHRCPLGYEYVRTVEEVTAPGGGMERVEVHGCEPREGRPACPADVTGDGVVGVPDVLAVQGALGEPCD